MVFLMYAYKAATGSSAVKIHCFIRGATDMVFLPDAASKRHQTCFKRLFSKSRLQILGDVLCLVRQVPRPAIILLNKQIYIYIYIYIYIIINTININTIDKYIIINSCVPRPTKISTPERMGRSIRTSESGVEQVINYSTHRRDVRVHSIIIHIGFWW